MMTACFCRWFTRQLLSSEALDVLSLYVMLCMWAGEGPPSEGSKETGGRLLGDMFQFHAPSLTWSKLTFDTMGDYPGLRR